MKIKFPLLDQVMKRRMKAAARFAVYIKNKGYEASLEIGKLYRVLPDDHAGSCPGSGGKEKWRILPVGEVHDQPAALAGGHRRNALWQRVSANRSERMSLSPSRSAN
jgi:hypothetical protein